MTPRHLLLPALAAVAAMTVSGIVRADAIGDFYKGKTMTLFVGSAPGGGYDSYARAVASRFTAHVAGHPDIVVKNMPGASGLVLAGYMYNRARKDGIEIAGVHNTIVVDELLGSKVQFKSTKFNWLGSANQLTSTCISSDASGVKNIQDAMKKQLLVGATGSASSSTQLVAAFMNSLTGTEFKIIKGYPSTSSVILAMARGEVGGLCGIGWDSLQTQVLPEIKAGKIHILVQTGMQKNADLPHVPLVLDLARTPEDRKVLEFLVARQYMGRPYVAPPGTPAAKVTALRAAFTATMKDPKFQQVAKKRHLPLSPITGQQVQDHVAKLFRTPKAIIARANAATQVNPAAMAEAKLNWHNVKGAKIERVKGHNIYFTDSGKAVHANFRHAKVRIDGKKAKRKAVKAGLTCDIRYLGDGDAAQRLTCKD